MMTLVLRWGIFMIMIILVSTAFILWWMSYTREVPAVVLGQGFSIVFFGFVKTQVAAEKGQLYISFLFLQYLFSKNFQEYLFFLMYQRLYSDKVTCGADTRLGILHTNCFEVANSRRILREFLKLELLLIFKI